MGIVDGIMKAAQGASAAVSLHQSSKYIANEVSKVAQVQPCTSCKDKLVMIVPKSGSVGQWIKVRGISPPGVINISSSQQHERTVYPDPKTGVWITHLVFTVPGTYDIIATTGNQKAEDTINIE